MPMLHDHRSAGAPLVRLPRRGRHLRPGRRTWRRRSRKAQVSAVATILGLLLVVTFIANYISTTLPNTMGQNDLQHDVQVQNQVAQLSALMQVTAESGTISAQVSQAVTLGSVGAPPFAAADSSTIAPANTSGGLGINFTLAGPQAYNPPTGGISGVSAPGCTTTSHTIVCSGATTVNANFTGALGGQPSYAITLGGGETARLNFSTNHSAISVTVSGATSVYLTVLGNNDTMTIDVSSLPETIIIVGNDDKVIMTGSGSTSRSNILVVGNRDTVTTSALGGSNTIVSSVYGSSDNVNPGVLSGTAAFGVYFNGFNPSVPSATCPVDNLSSTDTVTNPVGGSGPFTVNYNNTAYTGSGTSGPWGITYHVPTPFACPFFSQLVLPIPAGAAPPSAALVVHLNNVYSTRAEVALDQGAVVYAQPGGLPVFVVPPRISLSNGVLSLFVPRFSGHIGSESGVGTADVSLRLLSTQDIVIPSNHFSFQSSTKITITLISPYAAAWYAYFHSASSPFSPYVTCTGSNSVCTALYQPGGPLGTITLAIPTAGLQLNLLVGLFAVNLA